MRPYPRTAANCLWSGVSIFDFSMRFRGVGDFWLCSQGADATLRRKLKGEQHCGKGMRKAHWKFSRPSLDGSRSGNRYGGVFRKSDEDDAKVPDSRKSSPA